MEQTHLEKIHETKLLGTVITSDLKWYRNTEQLVRGGYMRMQVLHKLNSFNVCGEGLKGSYVLYIRSVTKLPNLALLSYRGRPIELIKTKECWLETLSLFRESMEIDVFNENFH